MTNLQPRNPFYLLLLIACVVFVLTALAYGVLPVLEEKAAQAGNPPPPSEFRAALRSQGHLWLLGEVGFLIVFGLLSMMLDNIRERKKST